MCCGLDATVQFRREREMEGNVKGAKIFFFHVPNQKGNSN